MHRPLFSQFAALMVLALALASGNSAPAAPILEGLYTFSNPSNLGLDSSGNHNNLLNNGGVASSGGNGPAFNGTNNSSPTSPAATFNGTGGILTTSTGNVPGSFPTGGSTYTVTAWVNTTTNLDAGGSNEGMIGWGNYGNGNEVNAFRLNGGSNAGFQNYWWANDLINGTATTVDGTWHMLAATYDGTTRTLFYDGTAVQTDNPGTPSVGSGNFAIGRTCCSEFFQGNMADVAVYNGALTQTQIDGIFLGHLNYQLQPVPEPASCLLAGLGAVGLYVAVRRRRRGE